MLNLYIIGFYTLLKWCHSRKGTESFSLWSSWFYSCYICVFSFVVLSSCKFYFKLLRCILHSCKLRISLWYVRNMLCISRRIYIVLFGFIIAFCEKLMLMCNWSATLVYCCIACLCIYFYIIPSILCSRFWILFKSVTGGLSITETWSLLFNPHRKLMYC